MRMLTFRQQQILVFILEHIQDRGWPPTSGEIAGALRLGQGTDARSEISWLEQRGLIRRKRRAKRQSGYRLSLQPT